MPGRGSPLELTVRMNQVAAFPVQRPSLALLGAEPFRAAMEFAWHRLDNAEHTKPGDGHPVVIFPGLGGDGHSVATLREHCRSLGYDAFDWGQGFNTGPRGDLDVWLHTLKAQIVDLLAGHTQPATLIGWSLGGLYAREVGKLMAPQIRQVITIATPFNAEADRSNVGWLLRLLSGTSSTMDATLRQRLRTPPRCEPPPSTAGRMGLWPGRPAATTSARALWKTSKSKAAISAWAGIGMCLQRSQTASTSHPDSGAVMGARNESVARQPHALLSLNLHTLHPIQRTRPHEPKIETPSDARPSHRPVEQKRPPQPLSCHCPTNATNRPTPRPRRLIP